MLLGLLCSLLRLIGELLRLIGDLLNLLLRLGCNGLGIAHDLLLSLDRSGHCAAHGSLRRSRDGRQLRAAC